MKIKILPVSLFPAAVVLAAIAFAAPPQARCAEAEKTVVIISRDTLKFDVTRIEASPGQALHVRLQNEGTLPKEVMGHNWILLDSDAEAAPYAAAAVGARSTGYEPPALASHVLAAIALLGPRQVGDATFQAPIAPGKYPCICSFPGHAAAGMRGELIVK